MDFDLLICDFSMIYFYAVLNQLASFDEYTRHEATAISRVTTSPSVPSLQLNSILQHSRVYDEYTRRPLLFLSITLGTRFAKRSQQPTD